MASANSGWRCKNCGHSYAVGQVSHRIPQHLLTTNNPPSETELILNDILPAATVEVAQELATLNDDIEALQKTLETLKARRPELEARLLAYKSIISPLRHVPPEIVAEIIDWATVGRPVTLDTEKGIWPYSRVSHMWRSVVVSTPAFWSTIHIIAPSSPIGYDHAIDCVKTILSRTGTHLLSLDFHYTRCNEATYHLARELLEPFIRHALQWRKVSLTIPDTSDFVDILTLLKDRVTCLEDLCLELHEGCCGESGMDMEPIVCFRNAPALRRVSVSRTHRLGPLADLFPWVQITGYRANNCIGSICWKSLQLMPNLLDLQLDGQYIDPNKPRLLLKKLRRLDFFRSKHFVDCLTLPALQDVAVCLEECEFPAVIDLIKRSECHITTLTLTNPQAAEAGSLAELLKWIPSLSTRQGALVTERNPLVELFKSLPSVSTLKLSEQPAVIITFLCNTLIRATEEGVSLLPALTELILTEIPDRIDPLVSFLQQRVDSSSTLPIKSVVFTGPSQPPLPPALLSLQHDGLHISFRSVQHDLS